LTDEPIPERTPPPPRKGIPAWARALIIVAAIGIGYLLIRDELGFGITAEAQRVCEQASEGIVLTAALLMNEAIENADNPTAMAQAIRDECPEIVNQILDVGSGGEDLTGEVSLELDGCTSDGASGTVRNNHSASVDITIEVQFLDEGVLIDTGLDFVNGLRPNQTGTWEANFFGDDYSRCSANVTSVFES
jgi:hypothetical protein